MTTAFDWQAQTGKVWAENSALTDRAFGGLTQTLLERLARMPGDRLLDIGCGAGELSVALARARPASMVTGVDISPDLVTAARHRGRNLANVEFVLSDAATWRFEHAPDLLVSRHGVMFFDDPVAAFAHIREQSRADANLLFSCFREPAGNPWATEPSRMLGQAASSDPDAPGPFAFADPERVRSILHRAGWREIDLDPVDFAFVTGCGDDPVAEAVQFVQRIGPAALALRSMDATARDEFLGRIARWAERARDGELVAFPAAAWIVSARNTG